MVSKINENMEMEFKEILEELMINKNYTQTELAVLIGVKQSQVSEWLKGKAKPGYDTLRKMALNLNCTAEYLLGISDI